MAISVRVERDSSLGLKSAKVPRSMASTVDTLEIGEPLTVSIGSAGMTVTVENFHNGESVLVDSYTAANIGVEEPVKGTAETVSYEKANSITLNVAEDVDVRTMKSIVKGVNSQLEGLYVTKSEKVSMRIDDTVVDFTIGDFTPSADAVRITEDTDISISGQSKIDSANAGRLRQDTSIDYSDVKGMGNVKDRLYEYVVTPLRNPESFTGISPPKGTILYGPSGTGKSMIARATASVANANLFVVPSSHLLSKDEEPSIEEIFRIAIAEEPSLIVLDDIDRVAISENPSRRQTRALSNLKSAISLIDDSERVSVVGTARSIEKIDDSLLVPSRFGESIEVGIPDKEDRNKIIRHFTNQMNAKLSEKQLSELSKRTVGYTGADLEDMCREATFNMQRRVSGGKRNMGEDINDTGCKFRDFIEAIESTNPSLLEKYDVSVPDVGWHDIGGYSDTITQIQSAIEGPLEAPELWGEGEKATGILLYGPPGTGKTTIARAMANESNRTFIGVHSTTLKNKYVGETERNIRELFSLASRLSPSIVYIDEIDSVSRQRGEVSGSPTIDAATSELLGQLDGIEERGDVIVVGSTNAKYDPNRPLQYQEDVEFGLDKAMLRPGRLGTHFYVGNPSEEEREEIFRIHLSKITQNERVKISKNVDLNEFAELTEGAVGADIEAICLESKKLSRRELLDKFGSYGDIPDDELIIIRRRHIIQAIEDYQIES